MINIKIQANQAFSTFLKLSNTYLYLSFCTAASAHDDNYRILGDHVHQVSQTQEETGVPEGAAGGPRSAELVHEQ